MATDALVSLRQQLAAGRLVLFVGGDLPATITGVPGRAELAAGLAERHHLPSGLSLAATAQRVMQSGNRFAFTDFLIRQLDTLGRDPQPIHRLISRLSLSIIITTAYDNLLELAFQDSGTPINRIVRDSDLAFVDPRRPTLIKLYGDLQQRDTLIVTEDDHYSLWRSRDKEGMLDEVRRAIRSNAVLLLGHSLTDPDFHILWREGLDRMGKFALGAYAIHPGMSLDEQRIWDERMVRIVDSDPVALLAMLAGEPTSESRDLVEIIPPMHPTSLLTTPAHITADLVIWLRRRTNAPHEALIIFRPPGIPVEEQMVEGQPPEVNLDPLLLLPHTLDINAYGNALSQVLFADSRLALALIRAQERALGARTPLRLRLQLDADDPALHRIRWELLRNLQRDSFLCTRDQVHFSRYLGSSDTTPFSAHAVTLPTALVAVADPKNLHHYNLAPLDGAQQIAQAQSALAGYQVAVMPHTTLPALADQLRAGPSILYLIAHGTLLDDSSTCLYLEGSDGMAEPIRAERFTSMIAGLAVRPRLVVLASCQSAGPSDGLDSGLIALGPQLAQVGVGAVLAMHDMVAVSTVTAGMPILFDELRRHGSVDRAMAAMRNVLATRGNDWWQPVLYLRLRDGQLWPVK
ncbi:CHAT domain-containing protein [Candidatus Viridilinea mediisalina]|uniref:CHAT domain-containing protein n=1 Tax=Candidatus Viridilinea mediisalina TaxID=2024553 RepID=A0A2A6RQ83_9CHLR|nr:CHAT domain-containing protein [Candidatus Viridilinea mediisalina]PDW05069.1 hypothetical protein CJ255_00310 [Candidatus Viridilinea mediisalina]